MLSFSHLIIIFILLYFLFKENKEGFDFIISNNDSSSRYNERTKVLNQNYIDELNNIVSEINGRLLQDGLSKFMRKQMIKAHLLSHREIMNDKKIVDQNGELTPEYSSILEEVILEIDEDEEKDLDDKNKEVLRNLKNEKREKESDLWGKTLELMTKKEMDKIYRENKVDSKNQLSSLLDGESLKEKLIHLNQIKNSDESLKNCTSNKGKTTTIQMNQCKKIRDQINNYIKINESGKKKKTSPRENRRNSRYRRQRNRTSPRENRRNSRYRRQRNRNN